jgi:small conductance mechanosensitive channel
MRSSKGDSNMNNSVFFGTALNLATETGMKILDCTLVGYVRSSLSATPTVIFVVAILGFFSVQTTTFAALFAAIGVAIGMA